MIDPRLALSLLAVVAATPMARAGEPACRASLSGAVTASFTCVAQVREVDEATSVFELAAAKEIEGVPSVVPGAFLLERPVKVGTFSIDSLGQGRASVAREGGALYSASKTSSTRGEVTLTLTSVTHGPGGVDVVHGTYRARLLPVGAGKTGEVIVEATF